MMEPSPLRGLQRPAQHANAGWGGPPSRQRRERIRSTLLGSDDGEIRCPRVIRLGFSLLPGENPLDFVNSLLIDEGYGSPEELRSALGLPDRPYLCRPSLEPACTLSAPPAEVLRQALMLGLCTAQQFDPLRPVIWTLGSLTRVVDLFDAQGFYQ